MRTAESRLLHRDLSAVPFSPHAVQFYETDTFLADVVARFVVDGIAAGEPSVLIAAPDHRDAFLRRAVELGGDITAALAAGRLVMLDARATLASFMDGDVPDRGRFRAVIGEVLARTSAAGNGGRVRAYGEMVEVLWREGKAAAAIRLEELWSELASQHAFSLLCAYSLSVFDGEPDAKGFDAVCAAHQHVAPAESYITLQHRAAALEAEVVRRERVERALHESREELLDFVENAPVSLHWVDAGGRIIWANQAELDLVGCARDEYVGHHISDFHADSDAARDILDRLGRSETLRDYPARLRRKDGTIRHVLIDSNVLWRDGKFIHTRCFTRDVTDLHRARDEQAARERFRELFIGMLGHDLRNPLGAITTGAELLTARGQRNPGERLDESSRKIVARISRSASRMARMIDQILDLARLNAGTGIPVERQPMDLADVCAAVIDELQALHRDRVIEVRYLGESAGSWDPDRLCQMLSNLIGNAIVHGDPGEPVRVLVTQEQAHVVVRVHNMGPPIPPEEIPTIFEAFRRAQAGRPVPGDKGLGLGLYITKEIVAAHGGTIDVRSTADGGTTFRVRLPCSGTAQMPPRAIAVDSPRAAIGDADTHARVLVVEDDHDCAQALRDALVKLGHEVVVVVDGPSALSEVERHAPDVVLLDLGLPTMDGVEVARRLREIARRARIVAVTGHGPSTASGADFDGYLMKPFGLEAIRLALLPAC
jgi:PAS domain S-box-containing protein